MNNFKYKVTREKAPIYTMGDPPAEWITALYSDLINDNYYMLDDIPYFSNLAVTGYGMNHG